MELNKQNSPRLRVAFVPLNTTFIGLPRALLFNMLYRDNNNGEIILRVDDTDISRAQPDRLQVIFDCLHWLGIDWNEGPDIGGLYAPYIQSQRRNLYIDATDRLLNNQRAYYCFCNQTDEERGCYSNCKNLTNDDVVLRISNNAHPCIRFNLLHRVETFSDIVHGTISKDMSDINDPVIVRQDGSPTFHLATAVDEGELHISHIVRGVDHIEAAFVQRQMMEALDVSLPQYMHFSVFVNDYGNIYNINHDEIYDLEYLRENGFLSGAIVNFLLSSGYSPKECLDCTMYSYKDFVQNFSVDNFSKSNQQYDFAKLMATNRKWIRSIVESEFIREVIEYFDYINYSSEAPIELLIALRSHCDTLLDLKQKIEILYDQSPQKMERFTKENIKQNELLEVLLRNLKAVSVWTNENVKNAILETCPDKKICYELIRKAIAGEEHFGSIAEIVTAMGYDVIISRIASILKATQS